MNLAVLPDRRAGHDPDGPALADEHSEVNNTQLLDAVGRAAAKLSDVGVAGGDVVAVMLPNNVTLVVALLAAWRLGAVVTPINPSLAPAEVNYQLADAGAKVLIVDAAMGFPAAVPAAVRTHELTAGDTVRAADDVSDDVLALLIYTSGTTGQPKGVMLDHANFSVRCRMTFGSVEVTSADRSLLILSLFHFNGIFIGTLSPLLAGGSANIVGRFSPKTFFDDLERSKATYFSAVPTIYTMLADLPPEVKPDTSAVRFAICGAAPASVELLEKFERRYAISLLEGYGLSDGTRASVVNPLRGPRKPGSVGVPLPGQKIRIAEADGNDVAAGEGGEVLIKGPNVMRGYLHRPEETAKTVVDGWLCTGDVGHLDEDGYLILVDRAKDMITRVGENIYPKEIEAVVYEIPEITEAAVVGRADEIYGEEPVLFVSLNSGAAIADHVRSKLSKY